MRRSFLVIARERSDRGDLLRLLRVNALAMTAKSVKRPAATFPKIQSVPRPRKISKRYPPLATFVIHATPVIPAQAGIQKYFLYGCARWMSISTNNDTIFLSVMSHAHSSYLKKLAALLGYVW